MTADPAHLRTTGHVRLSLDYCLKFPKVPGRRLFRPFCVSPILATVSEIFPVTFLQHALPLLSDGSQKHLLRAGSQESRTAQVRGVHRVVFLKHILQFPARTNLHMSAFIHNMHGACRGHEHKYRNMSEERTTPTVVLVAQQNHATK